MVKDLMPQLQAASKHARKNLESSEKAEANGKQKHTSVEMKPIKDTDKNMSASTDEFFKTFENVIDHIDKIEKYINL